MDNRSLVMSLKARQAVGDGGARCGEPAPAADKSGASTVAAAATAGADDTAEKG